MGSGLCATPSRDGSGGAVNHKLVPDQPEDSKLRYFV